MLAAITAWALRDGAGGTKVAAEADIHVLPDPAFDALRLGPGIHLIAHGLPRPLLHKRIVAINVKTAFQVVIAD